MLLILYIRASLLLSCRSTIVFLLFVTGFTDGFRPENVEVREVDLLDHVKKDNSDLTMRQIVFLLQSLDQWYIDCLICQLNLKTDTRLVLSYVKFALGSYFRSKISHLFKSGIAHRLVIKVELDSMHRQMKLSVLEFPHAVRRKEGEGHFEEHFEQVKRVEL